MKRKVKEPSEAAMRAELGREFDRWNEIARNGCSDPFWADGVNLNLVRNHILYHYRQLAERGFVQMDLFGEPVGERPIPPQVDNDYMVKNGRYPGRLEGKVSAFTNGPVWGYAGQYQA